MIIFIQFVNVATGECGIPAYIDAAKISKWYRWQVPDDLPFSPNQATPHRSLRGKQLTVIENENGQSWSDEPFWQLSASILEARGEKALSLYAKNLAAEEKGASKSPLAV